MILIHQRYRRTDVQTDGQQSQSQYRALHYSASRGKKKLLEEQPTPESESRTKCH